MKLFALKKTPKADACDANRCTVGEGLDEMPGDLWGRDQVLLCPKHGGIAIAFVEANPDYEPETAPASADVNDAKITTSLAPFVEQGEEVAVLAKDFKIETHEQLVELSGWLAEVKTQRNELERMEKEITGPLNIVLQRVRSLFRPAKTFWADAEKRLKAKISAAKLLEETRNHKALIAAAAAHKAGNTEARTEALAKVTTIGDVSGISTSSKWTFVIEDESKLPREFLTANLKLIKEHCAHSTEREPTAIAGVKFIPDVRVAVTPSKVVQ